MINGSPQPPALPETVPELQEMVRHLQRYCDVFRQQRDRAQSHAADLQAEYAQLERRLRELEASAAASRDAPADRTEDNAAS